MQSTRMDTATPDVSEEETLLVGSDQGGARADRPSPLRARAIGAAAVLLLVAGCLAVAPTSAREPVRSQAAPGGVVRLVGADRKAMAKPKPLQASESATPLSEDDCAELRTLYASATGGEPTAVSSLKERGIDLEEFGPGVDPCQVVPALAKAKATAKFDEAMGGSSKARRNTKTTSTHMTTTRSTTTATSAHTTTTRTTADEARRESPHRTRPRHVRPFTTTNTTTTTTRARPFTTTNTTTTTTRHHHAHDHHHDATTTRTASTTTRHHVHHRSPPRTRPFTTTTATITRTTSTHTTTTTTHTTTATTTTHTTTTTTSDKCSGAGQDCRNTTCCSLPGMQCYEKSRAWAQCKATCVPGKDPADVDSVPWTCKELGERTPGEPEACSEVNENCIKSRCCTGVGLACYAKNETFATCRAGGCTPGPDYADEDGWEPWTCERLGDPVPGKGPWVDEECASDEDDCREAACCRTSGHQCYEMGEGWAQCRARCSTEPANGWEAAWTCREIGQRTPPSGRGAGLGPRNGRVASWVGGRCSGGDGDCTHTQCCSEVGAVCYKKDKTYAKCMTACDPSDPGFHGWACEEKGSRSFGVARKTWPSLFCFSVIRLCDDEEKCYEHALVNRIYELGPDSAGIFGCDDWMVLSNEPAEVGGRDATLIPGNIKVGISKDGTAANTKLFMKVWDLVIEDGRFKMHDWTVKMDPDAVLLPWKLGDHLAPHTNNGEHDGRLFVVNCNAWPGSESFPMMYGSVEIFSKGAMIAYMEHVALCADVLPWEDWGEDFFITRCMDQIDVGRLEMFNVVGDNLCVGPGQGGTGDCSEGDRAAFHPFKDIEAWNNCYNNAAGYHPETPAPPPPEEQAEGDNQWGHQDGQGWQRLKTL